MPKWETIAFTTLELKGLWVRATGGDTSTDPLLDLSADNAIDKVYRAERGMPRRAPHDKGGGRHVAALDVQRRRKGESAA